MGSATITEADRAVARARAEAIATRWVPAHMTARQGLVDDITAALENARQLGIERGEEAENTACEDEVRTLQVIWATLRDAAEPGNARFNAAMRHQELKHLADAIATRRAP